VGSAGLNVYQLKLALFQDFVDEFFFLCLGKKRLQTNAWLDLKKSHMEAKEKA
jgi:hypothetical protein